MSAFTYGMLVGASLALMGVIAGSIIAYLITR